jgi:hypothetical protein
MFSASFDFIGIRIFVNPCVKIEKGAADSRVIGGAEGYIGHMY